jgi:hypothetical protein
VKQTLLLTTQLSPQAPLLKQKQGYTIAYKSEVGFAENTQNDTESSLP